MEGDDPEGNDRGVAVEPSEGRIVFIRQFDSQVLTQRLSGFVWWLLRTTIRLELPNLNAPSRDNLQDVKRLSVDVNELVMLDAKPTVV